MSGTIKWSEFLHEAKELVKISEKINDSWILIEKLPPEENSYLVYKQKLLVNLTKADDKAEINSDESFSEPAELIPDSRELISLEYHVVYSISYQVPILYFNGYRNNGTQISLEDSWKIFKDYATDEFDMLSILTQMEHPILFRPFLTLHPCRTAEILSNTQNSKNRIVTFLSVIGPYIQIKLRNEYGLHFKD